MNPVTLARALVEIPSPSGDEAAVVRHVATVLRNLDLRVEQQQVASNRFNLVATTTSPPRVVFACHLDTVPGEVEVREDDTHLYGRGAADSKGAAAVQLAAASKLLESGETRIGLLFTVDQEMSALGAQEANGHPVAEQCAFLIGGMPTGGKIAESTKGSLRVRLTTRGRESHSAHPENGDSSIVRLLDALATLRGATWPTDERLGETTLNVGVISGGTRHNVIPGSACADVQLHLVSPAAQVEEQLRALVGADVAVEVIAASDPLVLFTPEGFKTTTVRYASDLPYLNKWGTPLLLGPGSILVAYTDDEHIAKADLAACVDQYVRLTHHLLDRYDDEQKPAEAQRESAA